MNVNFQVEDSKLRETKEWHRATLQDIVTTDTRYQVGIMERGGTMLTTLTPEAEAAAAKVTQQRDRALANLARPVIEASKVEHAALVEEAKAAADVFLAKRQRLANFEQNLNTYLGAAGATPLQQIATANTDNAREFLARVESVATATSPRPVLQPLERPNFSDLVS